MSEGRETREASRHLASGGVLVLVLRGYEDRKKCGSISLKANNQVSLEHFTYY